MEIGDVLAMLGLNLPKVILVNTLTEWLKTELEILGWWIKVRRFGFFLPFAAAPVICYLTGDETVAGAARCGAIYGAAALIVHHFQETVISDK